MTNKEAIEELKKVDTLDMPARLCEAHYMAIKALEQKPKTGHWEWLTEDKYRCSNCNHETRVDECMGKLMYNYCPFCGARMAESEDKE